MIPDIKDIYAGEGLGRIKFGMTRKEVKDILGEPDEAEVFSPSDHDGDDDEQMESWHFDSHEISASFDEMEDWRLVTLSVSSSDYLFEGKKLIGMDRKDLIKTLNELDLKDLEYEDWSTNESPDHKLISAEEAGMNFWLDEGVLTEIQWGPLFSDDDEIEWPE